MTDEVETPIETVAEPDETTEQATITPAAPTAEATYDTMDDDYDDE